MANTIEIDTSGLRQMTRDLQDALGRAGKPADLTEIVRDESRRYCAEVVKLLPPHTAKEGQTAITRDQRSLFSAASSGLIKSVIGRKRKGQQLEHIDTVITTHGGNPLRLMWDRVDQRGANMKAHHHRLLDARGHAPKAYKSQPGEWRARTVVPEAKYKKYLKEQWKKVGRLKASVAATAVYLGATRVAPWIRRHIKNGWTPKSITNPTGLRNGANPSLTFGSRARGMSRFVSVWKDAARVRGEAMKRRIRLVRSGYARDLAKRMKIQRKERSTGTGGRYVIG